MRLQAVFHEHILSWEEDRTDRGWMESRNHRDMPRGAGGPPGPSRWQLDGGAGRHHRVAAAGDTAGSDKNGRSSRWTARTRAEAERSKPQDATSLLPQAPARATSRNRHTRVTLPFPSLWHLFLESLPLKSILNPWHDALSKSRMNSLYSMC